MKTAVFDNLTIGTLGWEHSEWQGGFYPDDLPEDWQLDYYANFSPLVVVPEAYWKENFDPQNDGIQERLDTFAESLVENSQVFLAISIEANDERGLQLQTLYRVIAALSLNEQLKLYGVFVLLLGADETQLIEVGKIAHQEITENTQDFFPDLWVSCIQPAGKRFASTKKTTENAADERLQDFAWHAVVGDCLIYGDPCLWIEQLSLDGKLQARLLSEFTAQFRPAGYAGFPVVVASTQGDLALDIRAVQNLKVVSELMGY